MLARSPPRSASRSLSGPRTPRRAWTISALDEFARDAPRPRHATRRRDAPAPPSAPGTGRSSTASSSRSTPASPGSSASSPTPAQAIHAAVLAAGRGAMASHRSAALPVGHPATRRRAGRRHPPDAAPAEATLAGVVVHRPRDLLDLDAGRREHVPATNILRTLCDLGALDAGAVPGAVGHVVTTGAGVARRAARRRSPPRSAGPSRRPGAP